MGEFCDSFCCETTAAAITRTASATTLSRAITQLVLSFDQSHRFRARARVRSEAAKNCRRDRLRIGLAHAAQGHARVFRFDDDHDAERIESFKKRVGDVGSEPFLKLQAPGK